MCTQALGTSVFKFLSPTTARTNGGYERRAVCRLLPSPPHAQPSRADRARRSRPAPPRPGTHCSAGPRTAARGCPAASAFPPSRTAALAVPGEEAPVSSAGFSAQLAPGHAPGWGIVPRLMGPPPAAPQGISHLRATRRPSRRGARPWLPPLCFLPASEGALAASARVTAARPAASDPQPGGRGSRGRGVGTLHLRMRARGRSCRRGGRPARPLRMRRSARRGLSRVGRVLPSPCVSSCFLPLTPAGDAREGEDWTRSGTRPR